MTKASLLTINQAAELVEGLSPFRLRQMCIEGTLPHIRAGNKYMINKRRLLEIIGEVDVQEFIMEENV